MQYRVKICRVNTPENVWTEVWDKDFVRRNPVTPDSVTWAKAIVSEFNRTRPDDVPRQLVSIEEVPEEIPAPMLVKPAGRPHVWEKTNLATLKRGSYFYDTYKCRNCTVTAKMFGIGDIMRDGRYKDPKWEFCRGGKKT